MFLESITLHHIRSYLHQELRFPRGSILLAGDIGAGKSSILLAIEFALFGAQRDGLSGESLLRKGAQEGYVELSLHLDGKPITVRRTLKKAKDGVKQDAGHIIIDGSRLDATPLELKTKILNLLGYPSELLTKSKALMYRYTVYTPQEHMKHILQEQKEERLDTLRRVFGVDKYRRMADNTALVARMMREDLRELQGQVADVSQKLQQQSLLRQSLAEATQKGTASGSLLEQHSSVLAARKQELCQIEEKHQVLLEVQRKRSLAGEMLRHQQSTLDEKQRELQLASENLEGLHLRLCSFPHHEGQQAEQEREELQRWIEEAEKRCAAALQQRASLQAKLELLHSQQMELDSRCEAKKRVVAGLEDKREHIGQQEAALASLGPPDHNSTFTQLIDKYTDLLHAAMMGKKAAETALHHSIAVKDQVLRLDSCPTCLQHVPASHKHTVIKQHEHDIASAGRTVHQYHDDIQEITCRIHVMAADAAFLASFTGSLQQQRAALAILPVFQQELQELSSKAAMVEVQLVSVQSQLHAVPPPTKAEEEQLADCKKLLLQLSEREAVVQAMRDKEAMKQQLLVGISGLRQSLASLSADISSHDALLQEFSSVHQHLQDAKAVLDKAVEEHHLLAVRRAECQKEAEGIQCMLGELDKEITKKQRVQENINQQKQVLSWLDQAFLPLLSSMERHVMSKIYHEFNSLFQAWFSMLLEDGQLSVRLDDSFSPNIEQNGFDMVMDSLSGGEKTAIALAYRLSLNRVINSVISTIKTKDIIILDEPTDGFSTEQLDRLRDVLHQLGTRQTIIVSHEAKIESFVDHVLRVEKEGHVSRVVG